MNQYLKCLANIFVLFVASAGLANADTGLTFNDDWINKKVDRESVVKMLTAATIPVDALDIRTQGGRVSVVGAVTNESVAEEIRINVLRVLYVMECTVNVRVYPELYAASTQGKWEKTKDELVTQRSEHALQGVLKESTNGQMTVSFVKSADNVVSIVGWSSSESLKTSALQAVRELSWVHDIVDLVTVVPERFAPIDLNTLERLVNRRTTATTNPKEKYEVLVFGATEMLKRGACDRSESLFSEATAVDGKRYSAHYGLALTAAARNRYEEALQHLRMAAGCPDFNLTKEVVASDFVDHPILVMAIPDKVETLAFQTIQMFELRDVLVKNQERFSALFRFSGNPCPEIAEARATLSQGDFDAAYANYMRSIKRRQQVADADVDEVLEALSIWRFAYLARISQISLALFDFGGGREVDEKFVQMECRERRGALSEIAKRAPPVVAERYSGMYASILGDSGQTGSNRAATNAVIIMGKSVVISRTATIAASFIGTSATVYGLYGLSGYYYAKENNKAREKEIMESAVRRPVFQILDWKEATIDYSLQKKKFKECMQLLEGILERENSSGALSSESLTRLYEAKSLMTQYQIYVDKVYRAFLFDAPLVLTLSTLNQRVDYAVKPGPLFNDTELLKRTGQDYSKLTPIVQYVALDETHAAWEDMNRKIKKALSKKEFDELIQLAKTQPNWLVDLE